MKINVKLPQNQNEDENDREPFVVEFPQARGPDPFETASRLPKRLKLFLWGDSGSGKTTLALRFPKPVVIDMEGGADLYGESFQFHVKRTADPNETMQAVDWLLTGKHKYSTLVIDPITIYWDGLQRKWSDIFLRRNRQGKGFRYEFYDLQPRDWMVLKAEFKDLVRKLIDLDMNVIVTARQKVQYSDSQFMRAIGDTFDGEKSLPYFFDVIVRLFRDDKGRFLGECLKDRSNRLPGGTFEVSYELFERAYGLEKLSQPSEPAKLITHEQIQEFRQRVETLEIPTTRILERIRAYGVERLQDLPQDKAEEILGKLRLACETKGDDNAANRLGSGAGTVTLADTPGGVVQGPTGGDRDELHRDRGRDVESQVPDPRGPVHRQVPLGSDDLLEPSHPARKADLQPVGAGREGGDGPPTPDVGRQSLPSGGHRRRVRGRQGKATKKKRD